MTSTPERWDDVGLLRLQLNHISLQIHDVQKEQAAVSGLAGLDVAQLRTVTEKLQATVKKQEKEMCYMKICVVAASVLVVIVVVVLVYVYVVSLNATSAMRPLLVMDEQSISSEGIGKLPLETFMDLMAPAKMASFDAERRNAASVGVHKISEDRFTQDQSNALPVSHLQGLQERHSTKKTNSTAGDKKGGWSSVTQSLAQEVDDGSIQTEMFRLPVEAKSRSAPSHSAASAPIIPSHIHLLKPLQFQDFKASLLKKGLRGAFWVCFATQQLVENVAQYAAVFDSLAQMWRQYAFVFLDTRSLDDFHDDSHLCARGNTTFVLEQENFVFKDEEQHVITIGQKFRKVLDSSKRIERDFVDKFLQDVHDGKVNEYSTPKELALIDKVLQDVKTGKITEYTVTKGDLRL